MRLAINHNKCRRTGQCVYLHPELFRAEADGTPVVLVEHPREALHEAAEEAVDLCPSGAIAFVEE
jgi:ferredoxin